jgi:hypothetical protein
MSTESSGDGKDCSEKEKHNAMIYKMLVCAGVLGYWECVFFESRSPHKRANSAS